MKLLKIFFSFLVITIALYFLGCDAIKGKGYKVYERVHFDDSTYRYIFTEYLTTRDFTSKYGDGNWETYTFNKDGSLSIKDKSGERIYNGFWQLNYSNNKKTWWYFKGIAFDYPRIDVQYENGETGIFLLEIGEYDKNLKYEIGDTLTKIFGYDLSGALEELYLIMLDERLFDNLQPKFYPEKNWYVLSEEVTGEEEMAREDNKITYDDNLKILIDFVDFDYIELRKQMENN